jgi:hypothetical protein
MPCSSTFSLESLIANNMGSEGSEPYFAIYFGNRDIWRILLNYAEKGQSFKVTIKIL